jgi:hypothetical protein
MGKHAKVGADGKLLVACIPDGMGGEPAGPVQWADVQGKPAAYPPEAHVHPGGASYGKSLVFHPPYQAASAAASNLAANAVNAVGDPNYRQVHDLRGMTKARLQGRIGGTVNAATRLRIQYHLGGNPAVLTGDAGWTTLCESAGSHVAGTMFYSAELSIPAPAQVNNVLLRAVLFSGDGAADPTITTAILCVYP